MTDSEQDSDTPQWPPAMFAESVQDATEQSLEAQQQLYKQFMSATTGTDVDQLLQAGAMWSNVASFKTRVQSSGRISIPDAEREALDIDEGDIVQTIVIPIKQNTE